MKKNQTFSILFYIKRTKKRTNGEVPVYCKVTISGKSSEWSLYKSIKENLWDKNKNAAKGLSNKAWVLVKLTSLLVPKAKEDEKEALEAQKIEINYIIPNASN